MAMPPGRPTKAVRLAVDLADRLRTDADAAGVTLTEFVETRCYQPDPAPQPARRRLDLLEDQRHGPTSASSSTRGPRRLPEAAPSGVCRCVKPTLSRVASTICTTCHLPRPR